MKKIILLHVLVLTMFCKAQDSMAVTKSLGLEVGVQSMLVKDLYRSPYLYKGSNVIAALSLERASQKSIHRFGASYSFGHIKTSFSTPAPQALAILQYAYLRSMLTKSRWKLHLGPQINAQAWRADYIPDMEAPAYAKVHSYYIAASVGLGAQFRYQISKRSSIQLNVALPMVNYIERPHFMDGNTRPRFNAFQLWNPSIKLSYEYAISSRILLTVAYQYTYFQYAKPKDLYILTNGLSIGLVYRGKKKDNNIEPIF